MTHQDPLALYVARLNEAQQGLYAFILTLVPNTEDARDVLAEANVALWQKREEYSADQDFWPWACRFARMQVMAYRKRRQRDRLVFGEALLDKLAAESEPRASLTESLELALEKCLAALSEKQRSLLQLRYRSELSVGSIAQRQGGSPGTVSNTLYRIRTALSDCIKRKLAGEGGGHV